MNKYQYIYNNVSLLYLSVWKKWLSVWINQNFQLTGSVLNLYNLGIVQIIMFYCGFRNYFYFAKSLVQINVWCHVVQCNLKLPFFHRFNIWLCSERVLYSYILTQQTFTLPIGILKYLYCLPTNVFLRTKWLFKHTQNVQFTVRYNRILDDMGHNYRNHVKFPHH